GRRPGRGRSTRRDRGSAASLTLRDLMRKGRVRALRVAAEVLLGDGSGRRIRAVEQRHHLASERLGRKGALWGLREVLVIPADRLRLRAAVVREAPEQE